MQYSFLLNICLLLFLGGYAYYKRRDSLAAIFVLFTTSMAAWNFCSYLIEVYPLSINANLVSQCQLLSALMFMNALYYFCQLYPLGGRPLSYRLNLPVFLSLLYAIFFTEFVTFAMLKNGNVIYIDRFGYILYGVYFIALYALSVYRLVQSYLNYPQYRSSIGYLLIGTGLFLFFGIMGDIILPILGIYDFLLYGYLAAIFIPIIFSYAITKHNLLDISVIIKRGAAASITAGLVITTTLMLFYYTQDNRTLSYIAVALAALIWAFAAAPLQRLMITTAKRKFVRGWYDAESAFMHITDSIPLGGDRHTIFRHISREIDNSLECEKLNTLMAIRTDDNELSHYSMSEKDPPVLARDIHVDEPLILELKNLPDSTIVENCADDIKTFVLAMGFNNPAETVIVPLHSPGTLEGAIVLGERSSGISYTDHDIQFFNAVMNYVAAVLYRMTPFDLLEKQFFSTKQRLHEAELQLVRTHKIEAIAHATRQCHHEIRTPLSIIKMSVPRVKNMDDYQTFKQTALEEIDRALVIIDETLRITDIAKPEPVEKCDIDINEAIKRCFILIPESGYTLKYDLKPLPALYGNRHDIEIIFTNLLLNAQKAMHDGGTLTISSTAEGGQIVIVFADTGPGIPEELRAIVWEPYTSGRRTDAGNLTAGQGWGLTIVNRIVSEHGGTIGFESEVGKGTVFTIRFPVTENAN